METASSRWSFEDASEAESWFHIRGPGREFAHTNKTDISTLYHPSLPSEHPHRPLLVADSPGHLPPITSVAREVWHRTSAWDDTPPAQGKSKVQAPCCLANTSTSVVGDGDDAMSVDGAERTRDGSVLVSFLARGQADGSRIGSCVIDGLKSLDRREHSE